LPTGPGMGATQDACAVKSLTLAAGIIPINTEVDPMETIPGPAGTHAGKVHGPVVLPIIAAGCPPISTVNIPVRMGSGRAGCADGAGTGAGGCMGAWQWGESCLTKSPTRAAAGMDHLI